jgi:peptide/nickel transport system substrate-binding protein
MIAMTGCASGGGGAGASTDSISASLGTDPGGFDPALARAADDYYVDRMLFDTLLRKDANNELAGGLATDWTADSASSYTFTIRDDATCSDGTEITPTVVADSLTRFADPETASTGRTLAMGGATAEFTADDTAGTVSVQLSADWSDFLTGMTLPPHRHRLPRRPRRHGGPARRHRGRGLFRSVHPDQLRTGRLLRDDPAR